MKEDQIRDLFQKMRDEPIPTDSLHRVQQAVTEQIRPRPSLARRWGWAVGLATAAGLMLVAVLWNPKVEEKASQRAAVQQPVNQGPVSQRPADQQPVASSAAKEIVPARKPVQAVQTARRVKPQQHRPPRQSLSKKSEDSIVIRLETEDPNVVILLVGE